MLKKLLVVAKRTQLNATHAQLLEKLRPIALAETCRFLTIQSLEFQEIWQKNRPETTSGAIIGDGDRKSWDARGPMIWDNFSIFRTNCAILTLYIRVNPRTCRGFSRGCCHVA